MITFTDVQSPAEIWQDDDGLVWISMSDSDPNGILEVESIDKLIQALGRARAAIKGNEEYKYYVRNSKR